MQIVCKAYQTIEAEIVIFFDWIIKIRLPRYRFHGIFNLAKQAFASEGSWWKWVSICLAVLLPTFKEAMFYLRVLNIWHDLAIESCCWLDLPHCASLAMSLAIIWSTTTLPLPRFSSMANHPKMRSSASLKSAMTTMSKWWSVWEVAKRLTPPRPSPTIWVPKPLFCRPWPQLMRLVRDCQLSIKTMASLTIIVSIIRTPTWSWLIPKSSPRHQPSFWHAAWLTLWQPTLKPRPSKNRMGSTC